MSSETATRGPGLNRSLTTWFALIALLACVSIGMLTYVRWSEGIRDASFHQLESLRDTKIEVITRWVNEREADLSLAARRDVYVDFCQAIGDGEPRDEVRTLAAMTRLRDTYGYHAIFLADPDGDTLVTTETTHVADENLPLRSSYLRNALDERSYVVSDVLISKVHNKPTMFFVEPILSPVTGDLLGAIGFLANLEQGLYPLFTHTEHLGVTGEVLLANESLVAQSPLKYQQDAVTKVTLDAEPIRLGAAGKSGRIAHNDYRSEPVMAAYGFIPELGWGLVAKQDLAEIEAPVNRMAWDVFRTTLVVLVLAIISGLVLARSISTPATRIAAVSEKIGDGDMDVLAAIEGPLEIRRVARSLNRMVGVLRAQMRVRETTASVFAAAGKVGALGDLLAQVLPILLDASRAQAGIVYLSHDDGNTMVRAVAHGISDDRTPTTIRTDPPDHLMSRAAASGKVEVLNDIPEGAGLSVSTHIGEAQPTALLIIPLRLRGRTVGVIGLVSLYAFDDTATEVAQELRINFGQYIEAALATEQTERMARDLDERNREMGKINEELEHRTHELQAQAKEAQELARELGMQREQVAEADRLKSAFLSNMSHELRTPLNSVLALSRLMITSGTGGDPDKDAEYLRVIERNGRDLLNLINDILDLSRIESGRTELSISNIDAKHLVLAVATTIRPLAEDKGLQLELDVPDELAFQGDDEKLRRVLLNLLGNATKFTQQGTIGVTVEARGDRITFAVSDTGIGIAEADLPHVFDEFRQIDGSLARQHEGTGLGLAISTRLAQMLGGQLSVTSELGVGSTFTLDIPKRLHDQDARLAGILSAPETADRPAVTPTVNTTSPSILVVDDNDIAALQIRVSLEAQRYEVVVANSGPQALELVSTSIPDAIVLDLMMPGMDGFEVLETIRSRPGCARIPVLILSARELSNEDRSRLSSNNVQELLQKGRIDSDQLIASIRRLVGDPPVPAPRRREPITGTPRLLLVEDRADNLLTLRAILEPLGAELIDARDGLEAVQAAKTLGPDLIIMDIQLPKLSGLDATRRIRSLPDIADVPIIALTGKAMLGDRELVLAAGCDEYLTKPVDAELLKSTIDKWLNMA